MKNFEKYIDDILKSEGYFALVNGKVISCGDVECYDCTFYHGESCNKYRFEWLNKEYVEAPELNEREKAFCKSVTGWLVRQPNGHLELFHDEPLRDDDGFFCRSESDRKRVIFSVTLQDDLFPAFSFIRIGDDPVLTRHMLLWDEEKVDDEEWE